MNDAEVIQQVHHNLVHLINQEADPLENPVKHATLSPKKIKSEAATTCHPKPKNGALDPLLKLNMPNVGPEFYLYCCFFISCIVARVFMMQCVFSKVNF